MKQVKRTPWKPGGSPRYVRCYDNGGETADRFTVVYTGRYRHRLNGELMYIGMSANPFHPMGVGQHGFSRIPIDRPGYSHLGKRIDFDRLPPECQKATLNSYRDIWGSEPPVH